MDLNKRADEPIGDRLQESRWQRRQKLRKEAESPTRIMSAEERENSYYENCMLIIYRECGGAHWILPRHHPATGAECLSSAVQVRHATVDLQASSAGAASTALAGYRAPYVTPPYP